MGAEHPIVARAGHQAGASGRRGGARRGITFLEVVLAAMILALAAAAGLSAISFVTTRAQHEQRQLACAELANRLIVIFLDDEVEFGRMGNKPIEYQGLRYRWSSTQGDVTIVPAVEGDTGSSMKSSERLRNLAVDVWLSEESGGAPQPEVGVPHVRMVRLVDIVNRNPDSLNAMMSSDERKRAFIERIQRIRGVPSGGAPKSPATGQGGGRTPPPNVPPPVAPPPPVNPRTGVPTSPPPIKSNQDQIKRGGGRTTVGPGGPR